MQRLIDSLKTRLGAALGVTAALLIPLALYGAPALARSAAAASAYEYRDDDSGSAEYEYGDDDDSGSAQYEYEVHVCHRTHSKKLDHQWVMITVRSRALQAHLRHGDVLSPSSHCPRTTGHDDGKDAHGNDHGKDAHGNDHGKSGGEKGRSQKK
jgi:hypothetical protein